MKNREIIDLEQKMKEIVQEQAIFDSENKALKDAIDKNKKDPLYEIWVKDGEYVVSDPDAWEELYRLGYERLYDTREILKMINTDNIEEV